jgi:hypothetical protein
MLKEVFVACFKVLLCGQTEEVHGETSVRIVVILTKIHQAPPKYKSEALLLEPVYLILRW